ncbi:hypothetical protein TRVA0_001S02982 [Trichomonascus vanleenenianus]|uniref:uncharacterized protein n=1 Tax=Trichomonascus vanleenenianus TaxID=2268995 RepID=UPI003ECAB5E5
MSLLDEVKRTDSVPYPGETGYDEIQAKCFRFMSHDGVCLGLILPFVAERLRSVDGFEFDDKKKQIALSAALRTPEQRTGAVSAIVNEWRTKKTFKVLEGWRDELYAVYNPTHKVYFLIERVAAALFGLVTYGVHIMGYVPADPAKGRDIQIWVSRRSWTKPTFPGMLDNTVAGGVAYPCGILETTIKECYEEAGLEEDYVRKHIKSVGAITYLHRAQPTIENEGGYFQPEVCYLYDIAMEPGDVPKPVDGEVASFTAMSVAEIVKELKAGTFKYNSGTTVVDFLIRHGLLTSEMEPEYLEIAIRTHRRLEYPLF